MPINYHDWLIRPRLMCGLMTGTSLDGVDAAIARFWLNADGRPGLEIIDYNTCDYPDGMRNIIYDIIENRAGVRDISFIHYALSEIYAQAVSKLCARAGINLGELDAVGIHGQTVWHEPRPRQEGAIAASSTLQLGSVPALSALLGLPVAGDFRAADIALGGQGAPLVPIFDYGFLSSQTENVIALNIGGMSNITIMPAACSDDGVRAFDTGPGNVLIDLAMKKYFNRNYDKGGNTAAKGTAIEPMLNSLKAIPFISQAPPKSTGRELFNREMLDRMIIKHSGPGMPVENIIRTLTEFTAWSIAENIRLYAFSDSKIVVSGGGSLNTNLLSLLRKELLQADIIISDEAGIPSDAKEAICFAYLAYRTLGGLYGNMPSVTGASKKAVLGSVSW